MSIWTQISGVIRVDGLFFNEEDIPDVHGLLGNTCDYNDDDATWIKCNVPCGSEGSLSYKFISTGKENNLNIGTYVIWGSLRNYENIGEIYNWVQKILITFDKNKVTARDLIFSIKIDPFNHYTIVYKEEGESLVDDNRKLILTQIKQL